MSRLELALLVLILLLAAGIRFALPDAVPPGPSHDELRMMKLGDLIVGGERPIHWKISYSAEPLFMYGLAVVMPPLGSTVFAARLVTRWAGLLLIPLTYSLARRLFDRRVALVTAGVLAVTWWPVFFSRIALRGVTLPLLLVPAVYCLWRGLLAPAPRWGFLAVGGLLMGLTWYTFTAARGLFLLLPGLLLYLAARRSLPARQWWRAMLLTLGLAVLVAAPFVYEVKVHPGTPEARFGQLNAVIAALKAGDPIPFLREAVNTLGLLLPTGDPNWRYNVSGRPTFGPLLGTLALVGLLTSLARWRRPAYFLLLLWLALGLAPSMLTPEAPSFVRAIGGLPPVAMLPGVGAVAMWEWLTRRRISISRRRLFWPALGLLLLWNGIATARALFVTWPAAPEVREIYQASLTAALRDLDHSDITGTVWLSEPFPDDRAFLLARRVLRRETVEIRWFDADRALILPPAEGGRRYLYADFVTPDPLLFDRWMGGARVLLEGHSPFVSEPVYRLYEVDGGPWVGQALAAITAGAEGFSDEARQSPVPLPVTFGDRAVLLGYELAAERVPPGGEVHLVVYWRAFGPVYEPLAGFAHLLDGRGGILGQYDGLDVPAWHWEPDAVIGQVYRFAVPPGTPPGDYPLEVGLYNPQTMERVPVLAADGTLLGDRLVLRAITVLPR